jgi:hypothetical protein
MKIIGKWIVTVIGEIAGSRLPGTKEERIEYLKKFRQSFVKNKTLAKIRADVTSLTAHFPLP